MAELASHEDDLAAVVALMGDKVGKDVCNIEWQVAPHVGPRRRKSASAVTAKVQKAEDAPTAATKGRQELPPRSCMAFHFLRNLDPVFLPEGLDPHAPTVMNVAANHSNCPLRPSGHLGCPEAGW